MRSIEGLVRMARTRNIVPAEDRDEYGRLRDRSNSDRLRILAWALIAVFGILLAQHELLPGVPRGDGLFAAYVLVYAATMLASAAFLAIDGLRRLSPVHRGFVLIVMLLMSILSVLDSEVSSDQSAFFFACMGMSVLFRCGVVRFAAYVLASAAAYVAGRYLAGGTLPTAAWSVPFALCSLMAIALAYVLGRYDARAFALNRELVRANERLSLDARREERHARELGAALEQRDQLLVELQHRVKNNLNLVASILSVKEMQLGPGPSARVLGDMRSRIQALASFYDRLYMSSELNSVDFAPYASDIIDAFVSTNSLDRDRISVERNLAPLRLRLQKAVALGLIMNELFTNSVKHAFPDGRKGRILIALESDGIFGRLRVADDGIGMGGRGGPGAAESFGLRLVSLLGSQIDAETRSLGGPGAGTEIIFPIP
jgi:two-component sensor histidine kinase